MGSFGAYKREMPLAEAQALECNGCGDCCDSRRVEGARWWWGDMPDGGLYACLNDGRPLIIPLREVHEGAWEQALPMPQATDGRVRQYTCAAFRNDGDTGSCALHEAERPPICSSFPVFKTWGQALLADALIHGYSEPATSWLPRCTWFDILIVPDARGA